MNRLIGYPCRLQDEADVDDADVDEEQSAPERVRDVEASAGGLDVAAQRSNNGGSERPIVSVKVVPKPRM